MILIEIPSCVQLIAVTLVEQACEQLKLRSHRCSIEEVWTTLGEELPQAFDPIEGAQEGLPTLGDVGDEHHPRHVP
jgi:hypothetical protein